MPMATHMAGVRVGCHSRIDQHPYSIKLGAGEDQWRAGQSIPQMRGIPPARGEIRVQRDWPIAIDEIEAVAGEEIRLSQQALCPQQVVMFQFDMVIRYRVHLHLLDAGAVDQVLDWDQHLVHKHGVIR